MTTTSTEDRLRSVARVADGVEYVRLSPAAKVLGVRPAYIQRLARCRRVETIVLPHGKRRGVDPGHAVFYRLNDLVRAWEARRMLWTSAETDRLLELAGVLPLAAVAQQLGRSVYACRHRLALLGVSTRNAQGLYTAGDIARMAERTAQAVNYWVGMGLRPTVRSKRRGHYHQFELESVRRFLRKKPGIVAGLSDRARRRLGLDDEIRRAA